jgi:hypothetical protein
MIFQGISSDELGKPGFFYRGTSHRFPDEDLSRQPIQFMIAVPAMKSKFRRMQVDFTEQFEKQRSSIRVNRDSLSNAIDLMSLDLLLLRL